jgi:hypothetical protein
VSCRADDNLATAQAVNRCLLDESNAHDELVRRWTEFSAHDRAHCARYSSRSGGGTYTDLFTCLEMGKLAGELRTNHANGGALARQ